MNEKKVREAIAKEKETIKTLEDAVVSGKTGSLRRWAKDTIENSTIIIEALEKQLPKKVEIWNGQATCPNCKKLYGNMVDIKQLHPASWDFEYCKRCGQRLDWSER